MGTCRYDLPEDFMKELNKLENQDEIVEKMLEEAAPIVQKEQKKLMEKHRRTGCQISSVKPTKVKKNDYGHYLVVRPTGKNKHGVRNMEAFIYGEYGTSTQKADPIQSKVITNTEETVAEKMQEVFNKEIE